MKHIYKQLTFIIALLVFSSILPSSLMGQSANFIANPTVTCVGGTVVFTDLSTGVTPTTSYLWNFGTGANPLTASGEGPHSVTYSSIGFKTVSLTLVDGSSSNNKTETNYITVGQSNTITLTSGASTNIQTVCKDASLAPTITYATTGATGATFTNLPPGVNGVWNNNVITIGGTPTVVDNYNFTITLTGGCGSVTANGSITVNPIPTAVLTSSASPNNEFCAGTSVTFTAGGGTDFTFVVANVVKQTGASPTYITNTLHDGDDVVVIVTSSTGCTNTSPPIINTVNQLPNPSITGPQAICGLPSQAIYTVVDHAGHTYDWSVTGGAIFSGQGTSVLTVDWSTVGGGTVSVVETITSTGCARNNIINITKGPASVGGTLSGTKTVCEGSTSGALTLNGHVGNILRWQYSNDLTNWIDTVYTAASFTSKQLSETTYFRAIVQSGACAIVSSTTATITVNPTPNLVINQPSSVCAPATINLTTPVITAGSDAGLTFTYWTNVQATLPLANPASVGSGTYYIRGESALGCSKVGAVTVVVSPKPNLLITPNSNLVCLNAGLSLTLTGQEGSVWSWIFPDTTNVNPVLLFPGVGTHTYSATATNQAGCTATNTITVEVLPLPVINITTSGGNNACVEQPKTYFATQNANYSYSWFVNDVEIPGTNTYTFTDILAGQTPTEIKVKVTNNLTGCSNADSLIVNPVLPPVLNMVASRLQLCEGDQTFITLSTTNPPVNPPVYFAWGDGLQGNVLTRGFIPTKDTSIWAEAINATGCITRKTVNILVRDTLAFTIAASSGIDPVCAGANVTFTGPAGASYKYQWFVGGVAQAGAVSQTFIRSFTQNATVRLIVTDTVIGCSGSAFKNIITKNAPVFNLGPDQEVCQNYVITLEGPEGTGFTYAWFRNAEATPLSTQRVLNFLVPAGVTTLRLEASSVEGCTTTDAVQITSKAVPGINLVTNKPDICLNDIVTLTATTTGATSVLWFDGLTTFGPHIRILSPNAGDSTFIYWAQAVNTIGCNSRDTVTVTVNNPPVVNIQAVGGSTSICVNTPVTIQGPQQPGYNYQWYVDGIVAGTNSHLLTLTVTQNVAVTLKVTDGNTCATISAPLNIQVINLPGIEILQNKTDICLGETVQLTINQQNISGYVWGDGLGGNQPVRSFIPETVGVFKFWANGLHNVSGCLSSDTVYVNVHPIPLALINPPAQTTVCRGQNVVLTTTVLPNHQYKWSINGDSVAAGASYTFVALQTRTVVLTVKNQFGCVRTDEIVITVEDAPEVDLGGNRQICTNYLLELTGPNIAGYTYKWFVNNVQIANNTHQYAFIVTQPVTVRLEATVGNCTSTDQITVTPLVVPGINLTANNSEICLGEAVTLQVSTTFATSFIWWDGLGRTSGHAYPKLITKCRPTRHLSHLGAGREYGIGCNSRDTVTVTVIKPLPVSNHSRLSEWFNTAYASIRYC
jgi:hypothetical protein